MPLFRWILPALLTVVARCNAKKIAVIGGGISGSFVTEYLSAYDTDCLLTSITVFEHHPIQDLIREQESQQYQHSRVASFQLDDGSIVELGASILHENFALASEMMQKTNLTRAEEGDTGKASTNIANARSGLGVYAGNGAWPLLNTNETEWNDLRTLYRYHIDLFLIQRLCQKAMDKFKTLASNLLSSLEPHTFFTTPRDVWATLGLEKPVYMSFDAFLDAVRIPRQPRWWLPGSGSIRTELLEAANLNNYNQDNSQINAMVGLGTFAAATGTLFSIKGGNYQLAPAALRLANETRSRQCQRPLQLVRERVTTVVGSLEGSTLYSGANELGQFDIVIVAAALQHAQISFLIPSQWDAAVLQPMPLGQLIDAHEGEVPDDHEGHSPLPEPVAQHPYTQVVTTVITSGVLDPTYFGMTNASLLPKSILMNAPGKAACHNITTITQLDGDSGLYKVFSDHPLPATVLQELFGASHRVAMVQEWGSSSGGATPSYRGTGDNTPFLLYDAAAGLSGHTKSGAIYYPLAMEQSSLACIELAATGAKIVAKLLAERVGILQKQEGSEVRDEL